MSERRFPVILPWFSLRTGRVPSEERETWPRSVPWSFVEVFREQAERNHGQTLERLAERGGLAPDEMWHAAHGHRLLQVKVDVHEAGQWLIEEMRRIGDIQ